MRKNLPWILALAALLWTLGFEFSEFVAGRAPQTAVAQVARPVPADKPKARAPAPAPRATFGGYPCAGTDCAEDKAGYRWAQENAIVDPDECRGTTGAFIEGCRVFADKAPHARG
jgi:hypothetical protein